MEVRKMSNPKEFDPNLLTKAVLEEAILAGDRRVAEFVVQQAGTANPQNPQKPIGEPVSPTTRDTPGKT